MSAQVGGIICWRNSLTQCAFLSLDKLPCVASTVVSSPLNEAAIWQTKERMPKVKTKVFMIIGDGADS